MSETERTRALLKAVEEVKAKLGKEFFKRPDDGMYPEVILMALAAELIVPIARDAESLEVGLERLSNVLKEFARASMKARGHATQH